MLSNIRNENSSERSFSFVYKLCINKELSNANKQLHSYTDYSGSITLYAQNAKYVS